MADNTQLNSGSGGDLIASDDIGGGVKVQRIKLMLGDDGINAGDASAGNPVPVTAAAELAVCMENLCMAVQSLNRSMGQMLPDGAGRMRVLVDAITGSLTLGTVTNITNLPTLANVTTLATLTNQTNIGGNPALEQIPALMRLGADSLRRNIGVS